jgi:ABC-type sugar transport system ATPase subunit
VLPLPPAIRAAAHDAGLSDIVVGIRPEHLHLAAGTSETDGDAGLDGVPVNSPGLHRARMIGPGVVMGELVLVEELGADALLHVRLPEGGLPVVARTEGRRPPAPGHGVTLHVQTDDVFAFHPVTGARLAG